VPKLLDKQSPIQGTSGSNREAESTDAPARGGLLRSLVERRERVIAIWLGSTGNGRNPMFNGRRQPSRGGTSRMMREYQVRFCERLGVKFPGPTRHQGRSDLAPGCRRSPQHSKSGGIGALLQRGNRSDGPTSAVRKLFDHLVWRARSAYRGD
jgi:hypothetical protein